MTRVEFLRSAHKKCKFLAYQWPECGGGAAAGAARQHAGRARLRLPARALDVLGHVFA